MFSLKGTADWKKMALGALFSCLFCMSAQAADLVIPVNRSALVTLPRDMSEVIVADPTIADVYPHGKQKLSIIGKQVGRTSVRVFDQQSGILRNIDVLVAYDLPAIRKTLKELMPNESIAVEMVNTNVALTGKVTSMAAAAQAVKIVDEFVAPYKADAEKMQGPAKQNGEIHSTILNLMEITSGQQVMLRVRVGEIRRTALKNLGVNLQSIGDFGRTGFTLGTGAGLGIQPNSTQIGTVSGAVVNGISQTVPVLGAVAAPLGSYAIDPDDTFGVIGGTYRNGGDGVSGTLQALERNGLFKILAEPNLVSLSGEEAQFLAGGEFPIIVPQNFNSLTVQFKPFGVSVKFKPTVLTENRIRLAVQPEVSEITSEGAIVLNGYQIPALNTRRASTVIELAPGESFMIAGLLNDNMRATIDQIPGLGEIPILSALFRSTAYQRQETELVLAVTPYLVDPIANQDIKLPTDNFAPASVMEAFFYGALGTTNNNATRIGQTPQVEGPIGFMVD